LSDNNTKRLTTGCPWCIAKKRKKTLQEQQVSVDPGSAWESQGTVVG